MAVCSHFAWNLFPSSRNLSSGKSIATHVYPSDLCFDFSAEWEAMVLPIPLQSNPQVQFMKHCRVNNNDNNDAPKPKLQIECWFEI